MALGGAVVHLAGRALRPVLWHLTRWVATIALFVGRRLTTGHLTETDAGMAMMEATTLADRLHPRS